MSLLTLLAGTSAQQRLPTSWFDASSGVSAAVECAFQSAPLADTQLWEDLTGSVKGLTVNRGRSKELDRFQPSTCAVTLAATDRRFDPEYSSGPHYGYIKPNRRLRVRTQMQVSGVWTDYFLWEGFVDEWPQDYDPFVAEVTVPCSDAFAYLTVIPTDIPFAMELAQDIAGSSPPTTWYRFDEGSGASTASDVFGSNHATYRNSPTLGSDTLVVGGESAVSFTPVESNVRAPVGIITGFPFAVEFMYDGTHDDMSFNGNIEGDFTGLSTGWMAFQAGAGSPARINWRLFVSSPDRYPFYAVANAAVNDGSPHHVVVGADANATPFIYIDGVYSIDATQTFQTGGVPTWPTYTYWTIGNSEASPSSGMTATFDEFVVWNGVVPSASRIAARASAALLGWAGDTTAERATHILDGCGWPSGLRSIGTGSTVCDPTGFGVSVYDYLMTLTDTERGQCYVDGKGRITFRGRTNLTGDTRSTVSQATFSDAAGAARPYASVLPSFSNREIRNVIEVTRTGGATQIAKDATSITAYGRRSYSRSTIASTDADSTTAAAALLAKYKDPVLRFDQLTILPRGTPTTLFPEACGREIGDLVTVVRTPQNVGSAISKAVVIEGVSHTITTDQWVTTFNLSPA